MCIELDLKTMCPITSRGIVKHLHVGAGKVWGGVMGVIYNILCAAQCVFHTVFHTAELTKGHNFAS